MQDPTNGSHSYSSYATSSSSYGGQYGGSPAGSPSATLRRRNVEYIAQASPGVNGSMGKTRRSAKASTTPTRVAAMKKLDFMFPKVDSEFTVQTDRGGAASVVAYVLICILIFAESATWYQQNRSQVEHVVVDTALGKRMRVNINITFPALACEDLHVDVMDVAGDSQLNVEDTMVKKSLDLKGRPLGGETKVESNAHQQQQVEKENILRSNVPEGYCGPCFGAQEKDDECCNTCDELVKAYQRKNWRTDLITMTSEQCIREGRDKKQPKRMTKGQGCNLSGHMTLNRVAGNFHIAMGEGIERDGRHIHTFVPDDTPNFNASHIIHNLSFGTPPEGEEEEERDGGGDGEQGKGAATATAAASGKAEGQITTQRASSNGMTSLNGATKIVTRHHGTTGLFQYFIKVVPTTYVSTDSSSGSISISDIISSIRSSIGSGSGGNAKPTPTKASTSRDTNVVVEETNRYFFTERFRPLMKEYLEDEHVDEEDPKLASVPAGHKGDGSAAGSQASKHAAHHNVQNAVLPGVFFLYEIYPFAVQVSQNRVPLTHLLIRIMATIGGVFTIVRWADSYLYQRDKKEKSAHSPSRLSAAAAATTPTRTR